MFIIMITEHELQGMKNITEEYELQYRCELVSSQYILTCTVYFVLAFIVQKLKTGPNKVEQFTNSHH